MIDILEKKEGKEADMLYVHYMQFVQERAGLGTREDAEKAIRAVFQVLDEAIPRRQAEELAETLPVEIRGYLGNSVWARKFSVSEFVERIAEKEGGDQAIAEVHARAVLSVLAEYLPSVGLLAALDALAKEIRRLFNVMPVAA